jgi:two-component system chemotaxis response regulator CheY
MVFLNMFNAQTRILVADDSAIMRKIIIMHLKGIGFANLVEAADGKEALEIIGQEEIDLILSDWNMPGIYGIDLLRAVRSDDRTNRTPFIMISAEAQGHQLAEAIKEGVTYYIIKPFTREVLRRGLSQAFRKTS